MPKPPLPDDVAEFLSRPNYATISVVRPDGQPVSVPTWYLFEHGQVVVNMDAGRKRLDYLRADPRISLSAMDPDNWITHVSLQGRVTEMVDDPEAYLGLPPALVAEVKEGWETYKPREPRADTEAIVKRKIAQLQDAGVTLVFGSDEGSAGELARHATWMDADLWVRVLGMDPMTVLQRMTLDAARVMGVERESGSITVGKYADIIAVGGDPLRHIDVLRDPKLVIKHGQRYK